MATGCRSGSVTIEIPAADPATSTDRGRHGKDRDANGSSSSVSRSRSAEQINYRFCGRGHGSGARRRQEGGRLRVNRKGHQPRARLLRQLLPLRTVVVVWLSVFVSCGIEACCIIIAPWISSVSTSACSGPPTNGGPLPTVSFGRRSRAVGARDESVRCGFLLARHPDLAANNWQKNGDYGVAQVVACRWL